MLFPAGLAALWGSAIRIKARLRRLRANFGPGIEIDLRSGR
jgi:hypothetical protein